MSVSITEIAKKLNISPSTVSRVLNGKSKISEETRKNVFDLAKDMNYIPNNIARNLKKKESLLIGIIIPDITESMFGNILRGIDEILSKEGYSIFLCNSNEDSEKEKKYVDLLYENRVDGIILATVRDNISQDDLLFRGNIPVVFIDNLPGEGTKFNCVNTDNFLAGKMAAQYLISNGHKKIAAIMGKQSETTGKLRYNGFLKALEENNIAPYFDLYKFGDFKEDAGFKLMNDLISHGDFTAVFITSSKMVYGALWALKSANLQIPKDISILGFDIIDKYNVISPGITSIVQSEDEIGKVSAELLIKSIKNNSKNLSSQIYMNPLIIERESIKKLI